MFTLSQIIGQKSRNENYVYNDFNVITVKLLHGLIEKKSKLKIRNRRTICSHQKYSTREN